MAKFILDVQEGTTQCEHCPFADSQFCDDNLYGFPDIDCHYYDLSTLTIKEYETSN